MKKFFLLMLTLIVYLSIRIYINDASSIKSLYNIVMENRTIKKEIVENKEKLEKLKKLTKQQKNEKEIKSLLKKFIVQRYKFKYNDYRANSIKVTKVKDENNNNYYIKVDIRFLVKKTTTLLTVINIFYKELFIEKIEVINKNRMILYLNKNKLIFSRKFKKFKEING